VIQRHASFGSENPFAAVDPILGPWADQHGIHVFLWDRDWEIRSFDVRGRTGSYQIWLSTPKDGMVDVYVWRRDTRGKITFTGKVAELQKNLDFALEHATEGRPTGESPAL
jgi:hypothetical protein